MLVTASSEKTQVRWTGDKNYRSELLVQYLTDNPAERDALFGSEHAAPHHSNKDTKDIRYTNAAKCVFENDPQFKDVYPTNPMKFRNAVGQRISSMRTIYNAFATRLKSTGEGTHDAAYDNIWDEIKGKCPWFYKVHAWWHKNPSINPIPVTSATGQDHANTVQSMLSGHTEPNPQHYLPTLTQSQDGESDWYSSFLPGSVAQQYHPSSIMDSAPDVYAEQYAQSSTYPPSLPSASSQQSRLWQPAAPDHPYHSGLETHSAPTLATHPNRRSGASVSTSSSFGHSSVSSLPTSLGSGGSNHSASSLLQPSSAPAFVTASRRSSLPSRKSRGKVRAPSTTIDISTMTNDLMNAASSRKDYRLEELAFKREKLAYKTLKEQNRVLENKKTLLQQLILARREGVPYALSGFAEPGLTASDVNSQTLAMHYAPSPPAPMHYTPSPPVPMHYAQGPPASMYHNQFAPSSTLTINHSPSMSEESMMYFDSSTSAMYPDHPQATTTQAGPSTSMAEFGVSEEAVFDELSQAVEYPNEDSLL